ncbi:MAG: UDP-N-acetylmuramoyl-L-alanyl-D-glutamate--2,6-diaminopimelate ligase [Candidatus Omnitrophota bacterium]
MRLQQLIKDLDYKRLENINDCELQGISCSSRCIEPGYLFVAIKGERLDGHNFVAQAINKGAKAVILEQDVPVRSDVAKILTGDSRIALAKVCAVFFGYPSQKLKVIGITGTNGKTTVSYLIEKILQCAGYPCGVIGTVNYRMNNKPYKKFPDWLNTTPQADILQYFLSEIVQAKSKYAVIEVSSHALDQHRVDGVDFSLGIFTNLTREHLDYHENLENYFSCKARLFENLPQNVWAMINIDDIWGRKLVEKVQSRLLTYSIDSPAQIQARNLRLGSSLSRFTIVSPRGDIEIETPLIGRHNVYNILAAAGAAYVENIDFNLIRLGVQACANVPGRLESVNCGQKFSVFVDYAHTEDALKKVLTSLRQISRNRVILVFGCGGDRDKTKRPKMGRTAVELADYVFLTTDNPRSEDPREIIADIEEGIGKNAENYKVVLDRFCAIEQALSVAVEGDIVVIAGKGHETTQIFAEQVITFDDREAVRKIIGT